MFFIIRVTFNDLLTRVTCNDLLQLSKTFFINQEVDDFLCL
jgi:hypothetical protein